MSDEALTWFDTHVHWDAAEFDSDRPWALERAYEAGVRWCLNPSVTVAGMDAVQDLGERSQRHDDWPCIFPALGIHPLYVEQTQPEDIERLEMQLRTSRPLALGEIGLDAYTGAPDFEKQRALFEAQLVLAARYQLPVILHVRHAVEAVIQTIKRVQAKGHKLPGGIAHAFNGSSVQAEQLIGMGFLLGFGGSCTYEGSTRIRTLATQVPLPSLVLETDAPDMAPAWLRGQRNESGQLPLVAQSMASLRKISLEALAVTTAANAFRLLGIHENGAVAR